MNDELNPPTIAGAREGGWDAREHTTCGNMCTFTLMVSMLKFPEAGKIAPSTRAEEADSAMAARSRQTGCAEFGCATTQIVRVSQTHMRNTREYNVVVDNLRMELWDNMRADETIFPCQTCNGPSSGEPPKM